ncbi:hypothetical protein AAVH_11894 [Aphelenchoides avenae]|nr:hypothetical protein AAVH_11894 [Aphelenchus avenae]
MPRRLVLEDSPLMPMAAHLGQGFLHPERLGTIEKVECYLDTSGEPVPQNGFFLIESAWMDALFQLGNRHVMMWYGVQPDDDFQMSSVADVLKNVAEQFEARGTSDFASTFDFILHIRRPAGAAITAPKVYPDVAAVELHGFYADEDFYDKVWDAYYIRDSSTKAELTILLKRATDDEDSLLAFRLKRGRMVFEAREG